MSNFSMHEGKDLKESVMSDESIDSMEMSGSNISGTSFQKNEN